MLRNRLENAVTPSGVQVTLNGETKTWADLTTPAFWRAYCTHAGDVSVSYRTSPQAYAFENSTLSFEKVSSLMREQLNPADWEATDHKQLNKAVQEAVDGQRKLTHISMAGALAETSREFPLRGAADDAAAAR